MIKRHIKETVTEFDVDGNIIRETVTETTEEDELQQPSINWPYGWWNGPNYAGDVPTQPLEITTASPRQEPDITVTC